MLLQLRNNLKTLEIIVENLFLAKNIEKVESLITCCALSAITCSSKERRKEQKGRNSSLKVMHICQRQSESTLIFRLFIR